MFKSLSWGTALDNEDPFKYVERLNFFKNQNSVEFKPGLNVLFGANGSGKSSLLKILAQKMFAAQGGQSAVTIKSVKELNFNPGAIDTVGLSLSPYDLLHDGQSVVYIDLRGTPGIDGGKFDDDFFEVGLKNAYLTKKSTGEATMSKMDVFARLCMAWIKDRPLDFDEVYPCEVRNDLEGKNYNEQWVKLDKLTKTLLTPAIERGQRTVLIDEPESGLSLPVQKKIWDILKHPKVCDKLQLIVATHSVFALNAQNANIVEMSPGYAEESKRALKSVFGLD